MQARDATGRQVSLLNDDSYSGRQSYNAASRYVSQYPQFPPTPELLRSDSYDSNTSYDAVSPLTPADYAYTPRGSYDEYSMEKQSTVKRPSYMDSSRSNSYADEDSSSGSVLPEKTGKRYPCRYRESHGCEKTFTTSGHASRHSKIHTAEKAVQCTYPGCHKKFTRADNMKQHLETHYKDKSRSSLSKSSSKSSASAKRGSVSSSRSSAPHSSRPSRDAPVWDAEPYSPYPSPGPTWDMRGLSSPLMGRPEAGRTSSGLDALAAIACQEGA